MVWAKCYAVVVVNDTCSTPERQKTINQLQITLYRDNNLSFAVGAGAGSLGRLPWGGRCREKVDACPGTRRIACMFSEARRLRRFAGMLR